MKQQNALRKKQLKNPAKQKSLQKVVAKIRQEVGKGSVHYLKGSEVPFGGE